MRSHSSHWSQPITSHPAVTGAWSRRPSSLRNSRDSTHSVRTQTQLTRTRVSHNLITSYKYYKIVGNSWCPGTRLVRARRLIVRLLVGTVVKHGVLMLAQTTYYVVNYSHSSSRYEPRIFIIGWVVEPRDKPRPNQTATTSALADHLPAGRNVKKRQLLSNEAQR